MGNGSVTSRILTSVLDESEWSASCSGLYNSEETTPYASQARFGVRTASMDGVEELKMLRCREQNCGRPAH